MAGSTLELRATKCRCKASLEKTRRDLEDTKLEAVLIEQFGWARKTPTDVLACPKGAGQWALTRLTPAGASGVPRVSDVEGVDEFLDAVTASEESAGLRARWGGGTRREPRDREVEIGRPRCGRFKNSSHYYISPKTLNQTRLQQR